MDKMGTQAFNYLNELSPQTKQELERKKIYQRYVFERARLERMAAKAWEETGKLSGSKIAEQNAIVTALGEEVLETIKDIEFARAEPSGEEFREMLTKNI